MSFVHLHLHNEYSVLDGVGTSRQYVQLAKELGQTYISITNHGNIDGAIEHQKQCLEAGILPIIGAEMYLVSDLSIKQKGETRYHITLLVENQAGWKNLLQLLTIANIEGFYHRPRIDHKSLIDHIDGLVVLSACSMSFINHSDHIKMLEDYIELLGKNRVFLEVMPHNIPEQIETNKLALKLSKQLGIQVVATNDCHYPTEESTKHQEVLLAIQTKKKWSDSDRWKFNCTGLFLRSESQMFDAFVEQDVLTDNEIKRALRRTITVAKLCENFRIEKQEVYLPSIKNFFTEEDEMNFFSNLVYGGLKERLPDLSYDELKPYKERIEVEMKLIVSKRFVRYFLIVWDLINWCSKNNILTGPGRGSSGGSLVAYLLFITDCDPLIYGTEFFRFVSEDRNDLPDIDMDFEDVRRDDVRKYLSGKYGEFNVVGLSNFLTMKGKGVLRDVSRVFDIPLKEVDFTAKAMIDTKKEGNEVEESFKTVVECRRFGTKYPEVVEICKSLEGTVRGCGQHAAGICISETDLREGHNCNLVTRSNTIVANWDMRNAEYCGLMKLDILGLSALTILNECRRMVKQNHGVDIDYKKITFGDPKVFQEISNGNTVGAFQIGSRGLTNYCEELGVENFQMIYAVTALWRPGPLQSGMTELYSKRKRKKTKVEKIHPIFDRITEETFGVIVYQEQVMKVINQLAGIPMSTCNKIRKVMGKSLGHAAFDKYKEEFLQGCKNQKTVPDRKAIQIWDMMSKFGGYGFNLSHSVEYSMITYWDMFSKTYYPNEFLTACLTFGDKDKNIEYIKEANRLKLNINHPKLGVSDATKWNCDNDGNMYAPFVSIKGVGEPIAKKIIESKPSGKRKGFFNLERSEKIPGVNKNIIKILTDIKAFDPDYRTTKQDLKTYKEYFIF
jgi:DNA polymerase-3 subunit alpha